MKIITTMAGARASRAAIRALCAAVRATGAVARQVLTLNYFALCRIIILSFCMHLLYY